MSRLSLILAVLLVLPSSIFAGGSSFESDFENFEELTQDEVLISPTGKPEMRVDEDARREIQKWEYLNEQGQPDDARMSELMDYI